MDRAKEPSRDGGANRTYRSIFGSQDEHELLSDGGRQSKPESEDSNEERPAAGAHGDDIDDDDDVWDDDFSGDVAMDVTGNGAIHPGGMKGQLTKMHTSIPVQDRRAIEEWADNEDEEDNWKEALQSRVDQLDLVVHSKDETHALVSNNVTTYSVPIDQRATLTLLPKTNLSRSISAPAAVKTKNYPGTVDGSNVRTAGNKSKASNDSEQVRGLVSLVNVFIIRRLMNMSCANQLQARKRSNSRDYSSRAVSAITRTTSLGLKNDASSRIVSPSNVFVRAVVARGRGAGREGTDTSRRIEDARVDKRAKSDERASMLALSDAEMVRRYVLNDVKKISVERIVADAKRLHFLEDAHRRRTATEQPRAASTGGTSSAAKSGERYTSSSPTKRKI